MDVITADGNAQLTGAAACLVGPGVLLLVSIFNADGGIVLVLGGPVVIHDDERLDAGEALGSGFCCFREESFLLTEGSEWHEIIFVHVHLLSDLGQLIELLGQFFVKGLVHVVAKMDLVVDVSCIPVVSPFPIGFVSSVKCTHDFSRGFLQLSAEFVSEVGTDEVPYLLQCKCSSIKLRWST